MIDCCLLIFLLPVVNATLVAAPNTESISTVGVVAGAVVIIVGVLLLIGIIIVVGTILVLR